MSALDWLRANYGWEAKRPAIIWLAVVLVVLLTVAVVGPYIVEVVKCSSLFSPNLSPMASAGC